MRCGMSMQTFQNEFTDEKARKVIASQEPDSYYEENCSKKIDNSGNLEKLRNQLKLAMGIEC